MNRSFRYGLVFLALTLILSATLTRPLPVAAGSGPDGDAMAPPTRLVIPRIGLDAPIEPVSLRATSDGFEWDIPWSAVGWHNLSATPGHAGNAVLSGHNFSQGGKVFQKLWLLKIGDGFTVYVGDQPHAYVVTERVTFREVLVSEHQRNRNKRWIGSFPDERVTLVTCHPTWTNAGRLVLVGKPLSASQSSTTR
ncbi:MAG TPA: class F sortase [Anaerolineae bacterium]|nr:class F sortase [Anaerolineae bacterium]